MAAGPAMGQVRAAMGEEQEGDGDEKENEAPAAEGTVEGRTLCRLENQE